MGQGLSNAFASAGTLVIHLDTPGVYAGAQITGRVYAHIQKVIEATTLQIEIFGREHSHVHWTTTHTTGSGKNRKTHTKHHHAYANRTLMYIDVTLANFNGGSVQPGMYEFPFSAMMPPNLPSSMCARGGGGDCRVHYGVRARLHRPGWTKWDLTAQAPVVLQATPQPPIAVPAFVEPNEQEVNVCGCFSQGKVMLGAGFDDTLVSRGQTFGFGVACKNNSSTSINQVVCTIHERVSWRAGGHSNRSWRKIAQMEIPTDQIAGTDALDKDAMKAVKEMAEAGKRKDYEEIYTALASGKQRSALTISPDARDTYHGQILSCSHYMELVLNTGCCITDPTVGLDIRVGTPPLQQGIAVAAMPAPMLVMPADGQLVLSDEEQRNAQFSQMPEGWAPVVAEAVAVPMGQVVLGGCEVAVDENAAAAGIPIMPMQQAQMPVAAAGGGGGANITAELAKLAELKAAGVLSDAEFEQAKNKALALAEGPAGGYAGAGPAANSAPGTWMGLKAEMDATPDDLSLLEGKVGLPEWGGFFATLDAETFGRVVGEVNLEFKQPMVAELLASRLSTGLTCAHVACSVRHASKESCARTNIVSRLPRRSAPTRARTWAWSSTS